MQGKPDIGLLIAAIRRIDVQMRGWKRLQDRSERLIDKTAYYICGILMIIIIGILIWKAT